MEGLITVTGGGGEARRRWGLGNRRLKKNRKRAGTATPRLPTAISL